MITQSELKSRLKYDPETGLFTWISSFHKKYIGKHAGHLNASTGYIEIRIGNRTHLAHRLIWLYVYGKFPEKCIDHIDMNRSNNKFSNLREATYSENACNAKRNACNQSGIKGVRKRKGYEKWQAVLGLNGVSYFIGMFSSPEDAAEAIRLKRTELHGEFANHG